MLNNNDCNIASVIQWLKNVYALGLNKGQSIALFCLFSNLCFSQSSTFDSIYLNKAFEAVNFTNDQKEIIVHRYNDLRSTEQYKKSGEAQVIAINKVNIYAHTILSDDQKTLFEAAWRDYTLRIIHSYHHHLNLTEAQKEKIIATMVNAPGFDSLKIIRFFPELPIDTMISLLDSTQLVAEAAHQKLIKINYEKFMVEAESERLAEATFEEKRVRFIKKYYTKHLQKEHDNIMSQLQKSDIEAVRKVALIYQKRVRSDMEQQIRECFSSDSILIAPIYKELLSYKYERFALQPNLCIYWCRFGAARTPEIKAEEKLILTQLEFIKQTYPEIIDSAILSLKKPKVKLDHKIEQVRPSPRSGGVVNLVSDQRTQALDEIAELLLLE